MGLKLSGLGYISGMLGNMALTDEDKKRILTEASKPIEESAKQNAPGSIAQAINTGYSNGKATVGVHRKDWKEPEYYPAYVECGHGGPHPAPPHPYIRPAFDLTAGDAENIIIDMLKEKTGGK